MAMDCVHLAGRVLCRLWHLIFRSWLYLSGSWELGSSLAFSDMWVWSVGVLDTKARLYYHGLMTSMGNMIRFSRL